MEKETNRPSRRDFIYNAGVTAMGLPFLNSLGTCSSSSANKKNMTTKKLGIALVGLGNYAGGQLAPALQQTENCYLAGIVTGTPSKIPVWKEKYDIPDSNIYNYDNFDTIKDNPAIDIVYVVLPNSMHAEYTIRAAKAGKHVICEKPMALTTEDCDKMMAACKEAGKILAIGYRLHFEPFNLEMKRLGTKKIYGNIKKISAGFGFSIGDPTQWRLNKQLAGGGPLQDLGIYCVQGICYTTGMEPIAVTALEGPKTDLVRFKELEQSLTWRFEMPNGLIAEGIASYHDSYNYLRAEAEKGSFEISPAFNYGGLKGITTDGTMNFPNVNQQAKQLDAMALSIKNNQQTIVPGELGKRDVKYITAIYEAMRTGKRVEIK